MNMLSIEDLEKMSSSGAISRVLDLQDEKLIFIEQLSIQKSIIDDLLQQIKTQTIQIEILTKSQTSLQTQIQSSKQNIQLFPDIQGDKDRTAQLSENLIHENMFSQAMKVSSQPHITIEGSLSLCLKHSNSFPSNRQIFIEEERAIQFLRRSFQEQTAFVADISQPKLLISKDFTKNNHNYFPESQFASIVDNEQYSQLEAQQLNHNGDEVQIGSLLFEDFFIIGPSEEGLHPELLDSHLKQYSHQKPIYLLTPSVLTALEDYPHDSFRYSCSSIQRELVKLFSHPYDMQLTGLKCPNLAKGILDENLLQLIFRQVSDISSNSKESFVVRQVGIRDYKMPMSSYPSILIESNPTVSLYCVCYTIENFLSLKTNSGESDILLSPVTFCFTTYYPFFDFFLKIIKEIVLRLKKMRVQQYEEIFKAARPASYCVNLDLRNDIANFQSEAFQQFRNSLMKLQVESIGSFSRYGDNISLTLEKDHEQTDISFKIPTQDKLKALETDWGVALLMATLSIDDFLFLFTAVSQENKVFFFSKNQHLVSASIITFSALFKPINYCYNILSTIPQSMEEFFEPPNPLFAGVNNTIQYKNVLEIQKGISFKDSILVDLDSPHDAIQCDDMQFEAIKLLIPTFKGTPQLLKSYLIINNKASANLDIFKRKHENKSSSADRRFKNYPETQPTQSQRTAASQVTRLIQVNIENYFVKTLPTKEQVSAQITKDLRLNLKYIRQHVQQSAIEDKEFIKQYTQGLMFTTYVHDYYEPR